MVAGGGRARARRHPPRIALAAGVPVALDHDQLVVLIEADVSPEEIERPPVERS